MPPGLPISALFFLKIFRYIFSARSPRGSPMSMKLNAAAVFACVFSLALAACIAFSHYVPRPQPVKCSGPVDMLFRDCAR